MKKIFLGLSGGVDSAVAAVLLQRQGYQVTAGFMRNWDSAVSGDVLGNPTLGDPVCPQEQDYRDAEDVADRLGIPLMRIDFVREYWDDVFRDFLREYEKGRTPNPDILCNKYIKFSRFYQYAQEYGFDTLATGHYAAIREIGGVKYLARAKDLNKDQTYFLDQVDRSMLDHVVFPLAELTKPEVRKIAEELGLESVEHKKDSTGICFIGERNFRQFLRNYLPAKEGLMVDVDSGEAKGKMEGCLYYTIGQRRGLGIGGGGGPWFVCGKDVRRNLLYVCAGEKNPWLLSDSCLVGGVNWLCAPLESGEKITAKFRYRQKDHPVTLTKRGSDVVLEYPQKVSSVAPGQQAVFYRGELCLGGGTIERTYLEGEEVSARMERRMRETGALRA